MKRVLFSLAAALALAVPSFAKVAQIGDKTYDSLAEFFVAFQSIPTGVPTTITLLADVEVDTQIVIPGGKDITLDLNGHTYTFNPTGDNNFYAFFLQQVNVSDPAVSLTIEDTSAEQTGTIKAIGKANACISATDAALTIHGGRFVQEGSFEYAVFATEGLVIDPAEGQTVEFPSGGVHIRRASISPYKEEGATITGGNFVADNWYALYVGETSGGTTVNISGGTFTAGKSGASVCFDVPAIANISGGDFSSGSLSITPDGEGPKLAVTGGIFKDPIPFADCGVGCLPARDENGNYTVSTGNVAAIQQSDDSYVGYPNVAAAIAAAENGATVTLIDKGTLSEACTVASGKAITLDLNGQDIDLTMDTAQFTIPSGATLNVVGKGTLRNTTVNYSRGNRIFEVRGASEDNGTKAILKVGTDVTLECTCGIVVFGTADTPTAAYGVEVEVAGTINNKMYAITTNGQITTTEGNVPVIKVTGKLNGPNAVGIYAAGYAKWDLATTIDADDVLSIKSGDFTIAGGSYTSSAVYAVPPSANPGGNETTGAAISITTSDGYAQKTSVNITGGTFISENGYALYEGIAKKADGTPAAEASTAVISITNGTFTGSKTNETITADIAITTAKDKQVVSGGTFNKMPDDALLTPGFVFVPQEDGTFGVIEGSYIASIGDVKYADFNSFFAAFKAIEGSEKPTTVTLLADLTGELAVPGVVPVKAGRNIVFDLNGHTMETALQQGSSTKHYYAIENSGTLTIKDSSAAQTGTIRARGVSNFAQGNLTVESGTLVAIDSDGGAALWNEGDAIVSGGKLLVEDLVGNLPAIRNEVKATLVVKGGEVQGQSRPAVINVGTMTIEGGLLWNTQCNVTSDGKHKSPWYYAVLVGGNANASLKMIGGTIRGTQGALTFIAGKGELTGGRCETVPCIYHGDTGGNIWHALYLSTTEGPVDVTVGGDFVAQSDGREAFVIGGNNEDTQKYTCKATVTGGTFIGDEESGFAALRVNNQRKDGVEPIIQGGHFEGGIVSVADTGFEPITNFVSGGTFSQAVELGYCAEGFIPVAGTEGKYTVDGTAVAAVANTETPGTYKGYGTLAALVKGVTTNGTEVLIVKPNNLGEEIELLKTATGGNHAVTGATAYEVAETLGGTFKVQDSEIVYAYQLGIADLDVTESGISVTVRLEEDGTAVTRTLEGRKVRVVSDKKVLAETDAVFTDGACALTVPKADLPTGNLALTVSVAPAAETPAE